MVLFGWLIVIDFRKRNWGFSFLFLWFLILVMGLILVLCSKCDSYGLIVIDFRKRKRETQVLKGTCLLIFFLNNTNKEYKMFIDVETFIIKN